MHSLQRVGHCVPEAAAGWIVTKVSAYATKKLSFPVVNWTKKLWIEFICSGFQRGPKRRVKPESGPA